MGSFRSQHRRRGLAVVACLLWLLGVEVLPNLHLASHAADHTHAADGTIVVAHVAIGDLPHDEAVPHEHADAHHSELAFADAATADADDATTADTTTRVADDATAEPHARHGHRDHARDLDRALAIDIHDPGHAAGGIAHRLLALHRPAPPQLAPIEVPRVTWWLAQASIECITVTSVTQPTARGPPPTRA